MRENIGLYKAKRKDNGEWVYGCMQFDSLRKIYWIVEEVDDSYYDGVENVEQRAFNEYEIDPETLCECTGLKDKNGKKIFEGDIVRIDNGKSHNPRYSLLSVDWKINGFYYNSITDNLYRNYDLGKSQAQDILEIIGNKFDNKELLGE